MKMYEAPIPRLYGCHIIEDWRIQLACTAGGGPGRQIDRYIILYRGDRQILRLWRSSIDSDIWGPDRQILTFMIFRQMDRNGYTHRKIDRQIERIDVEISSLDRNWIVTHIYEIHVAMKRNWYTNEQIEKLVIFEIYI